MLLPSGAILLPVQFRVHVQSSLSTSAASSSMYGSRLTRESLRPASSSVPGSSLFSIQEESFWLASVSVSEIDREPRNYVGSNAAEAGVADRTNRLGETN